MAAGSQGPGMYKRQMRRRREPGVKVAYRYASILAAAALVLSSSAAAFADTMGNTGSPTESTQATECATTTIQSGTLTATSANFAAGTPIKLDGQAQTGKLTGSGTVVDNTGLGMGWTLTEGGTALTLEQLASPDENASGLGKFTLPTTLSVSDPTPSTGITVGAPVTLTNLTGAVVLTASAGNGMGTTTFAETLAYTVPIDAYAGVYDATVTVQADELLPANPNTTTTTYTCSNSASSGV